MEAVVALDASFWNGRRVLITGHTGFKGSWLALWLHRLGAAVSGYALTPHTTPNLYDDAGVAEVVASTTGDVTDRTAVATVMREAEPEIIFHLAAQSLVRESYARPIETMSINVLGTAMVLDAARQSPGVQAIVVVTSDKCYENREWTRPYRESDPLGGHDPYSASKACAELVTAAWRKSFFEEVGVATVRAGNVIGGGDWAGDRLVPDCVRALEHGEIIRVRNPDAERPWQHVLEPLAGYLRLAEQLARDPKEFSSEWNFGPAETDVRPVAWIVAEIARRWGAPDAWAAEPPSGPHEASVLRLDASKARKRLGVVPRLTIDDAIEWTVDWYARRRDGDDARAVTLEQIDRFERIGDGR